MKIARINRCLAFPQVETDDMISNKLAEHGPGSDFRSDTWRSTPTSGQKWEIHAGDARQVMARFSEESFSCVITSPPYYWQRDYGVNGQIGMEPSVTEYVDSIVATMAEVKRVLKQDGTLFLNLGDTYYSGKGQPHGKDNKHSARRMGVLRAVDASGLGFPKKSLLGLPL